MLVLSVMALLSYCTTIVYYLVVRVSLPRSQASGFTRILYTRVPEFPRYEGGW